MLNRFVDTSGWAAWADRDELFHPQALVGFDEVWDQNGLLTTTNYVLAELTALLTRLRMPKNTQVLLFDDLRNDTSVEIVHIDPSLEEAAWRLWKDRMDKDWTLVDCASFVVMQQRGLAEALSTDHHFDQAGFIRLLK
jgi:predicted nucleic acid-binding protein